MKIIDYKNIDWYSKTENFIADYYYDSIDKTQKYEFLIFLKENFPDLKIEWISYFESIRKDLFLKEKIDEILSFIDWHQSKFPNEYCNNYEFIEYDLINYYIYKNDWENVQKRVQIVESNPVHGIDVITLRLLYQLIYNGKYETALNYSKNVVKPIADSEKIYGEPDYYFSIVVYFSLIQNYYDLRNSKNQPNKNDIIKELIENYNFSNSEKELDTVFDVIDGKIDVKDIFENKNIKNQFFILNVAFNKYMFDTYHIPFVLADQMFSFVMFKKLYPKNNSFYIEIDILDKHIAEKYDYMFSSNNYEIVGKVWSLDYVAKYFYDNQLITEEEYEKSLENNAYLINEFLKIEHENLWQFLFLFKWPKINKHIDYAQLETLFKHTYLLPNEKSLDLIENYVFSREIPARIKKILKIKSTPFENIKNLSENAPKVNRNDLCSCGSGKKYKKCCLNKTDN